MFFQGFFVLRRENELMREEREAEGVAGQGDKGGAKIGIFRHFEGMYVRLRVRFGTKKN